MKHLKTYKIFESNDNKFTDEFINIIKDICLDLTDIEYTVDYKTVVNHIGSPRYLTSRYLLEVEINSEYETEVGFDVDILRDILTNIKDVVSEYGFSVEVYVPANDEYLTIDEAISFCSSDNISLTQSVNNFSNYTSIILEIS